MKNENESDEPIYEGLENLRRVADALAALEEQEKAKASSKDSGNLGLPVVHLETEMFDAWAVAFFAMPGLKIIEVMLVPEEMRTPAFMELFKLALQDPAKVQDLEVLTFRELQTLIQTWLILSNKLERQTDGDLSIQRETGEDTP